ncbi:hypothetical protein [Haloarcula rubripromontorii]|uniref:hypothetical protein n=1 Tax=Haloarcula rubripromontorii TaxID=1705562 RepID=UPI00345C26F2
MSKSIDSLGETVRAAEEVTEESIEGPVVSAIHASMDDSDRARILDLYDEGVIAEQTARRLLGDERFEDAVEMTQGAEMMLSGDSDRYIID